MKISKQVTGITQKDGKFLIDTDGGKFMVVFLKEDLVRIRCTFEEAFPEEASYTLVMTAWEDRLDPLLKGERKKISPYMPEAVENEEYLELKTAALQLRVGKQPFGISIYNSEGVCVLSDVRERAYQQDDHGRVYHYVSISEQDCFYGFGEKTGSLNKAKKRMRMNNVDTLGYDAEKADPLYKHIPFYLRVNKETKAACGLFYHNSWPSEFDMGCERSGYWQRYSYFCADGGDIDLFFLYGPSMEHVVEGYTDLTGKTVLPPLYSLGYMGSTMFYTELEKESDEAILSFSDKAAKNAVPCDGFHMSSGYTTGEDGKRYVFNWNPQRFKDPGEFVRRMEEKGMALSPNVKPGMLLSHFLYGEFKDQGAYIMEPGGSQPQVDRYWGGKASFVDFTNPRARELWKKHLKKALISLGITAIWNDNNEYEINDPGAVCDFEGEKGRVEALRPLLPNLMAYTAYQAVLEEWPHVRPYILNRAGFAGIQRYAQTWAGDNNTSWKSLKFNIATMLGMGLSGVANQGIDVGGFDGPAPEPELLVRWVQNGVFYPRFCLHSANNDNTVTEPWMYPSYTPYIRKALEFRYRLIPYLYSLMYQAAERGTPVMRPLVYEFQQDVRVYEESFDFMLGPYLLVAGVFEKGAVSREVYLPEGSSWYDWDTREKYDGGQTLGVETPLDKIPVFIRSGAILPMTAPSLNLRKEKPGRLELLVDPREESSFTFYEDDGTSNDYLKGIYCKTTMTVRAKKGNADFHFALEGSYRSGIREIVLEVICGQAAPIKINAAGKPLPMYLDKTELEKQPEGFCFDAEKRSARIKYPRPEGDYSVSLCFDAKDLISI